MADTSNSTEIEIWKDVPGWEEFYQVSSLGKVLSKDRVVSHKSRWGSTTERLIKGRTLAQTKFNDRYWQVSFKCEGARKTVYVHRLVCEAFHGEPPEDAVQVAHYDGNGLNNSKGNLRWATVSENNRDKIRHGKSMRGESHPNAKVSNALVRRIQSQSDNSMDRVYASVAGVKAHTIANIRLGHQRAVGS